MQVINCESASTAWIKTINFLLKHGKKTGDIVEVLNVCIIIEKFLRDSNFEISFRDVFGDDRIDYASSVTFISPKKEGNKLLYTCINNNWKSSYWGRMINYNGEFNQIENVLTTLRKGANIKRCELLIYNPIIDAKNMYGQPCLLAIDLKPRFKKLYMTAFFRSQRVSKSGYADYCALIRLGKFLARESNMSLECVTIIATSCHLSNDNKELDKSKILLNLLGE